MEEKGRTKIVATLGPASASKTVLRDMVIAGMDVARINFSHGTTDANLELLRLVREAARAEETQVAIMQDLQGPKLRVGQLPEDGWELVDGLNATLLAGAESMDGEAIPVLYKRLAGELKAGDRILLNDGLLELEVTAVKGKRIYTKVLLGGTLLSNQGLTIPSVSLSLEALTEKDEADLSLGLKEGVDFVAMSFVRTVDDVLNLKQKIVDILPDDVDAPAVVVKIEKHEALKNFDAILEEADAVMIARGDLGLATSLSSVPVAQKEIVARCLVAGKPVVVATHMLSSMTIRPRPTRAEVSDVANAVIDHTDAVMLSEETALGRYPVRSVKTMAEIIARTEESPLDNLMPHREAMGEPVPQAAAAAAVELARHVEAEAILITTHSGYSARAIARYRPETRVFAATDDPVVQRQLMLSWGITPIYVEGYKEPEKMMGDALDILHSRHSILPGSRIIVVSGLKRKETYDSAVRVVEV
ncbi:MAG: pyruvate kinase [bacterium]